MHEIEDHTPPDVSVGHEMRDISTRVVRNFGIALVVGAVIVHAAIWLLYVGFARMADRADVREFPLAAVGAPARPPEPRLQTQPREELKQLVADQERRLSTYGWVDPAAGLVHVPIEQAMRTTVEQGLPVRPPAVADPAATTSAPEQAGGPRSPAGRAS